MKLFTHYLTTLTVCFVLIQAFATNAGAAIRYVNHAATGTNSGTSWTNAYTRLQNALAASSSGDQIWMAAGTYKPSTTGDRMQRFSLPSGVAMYGGFIGSETQLSQRNSSLNQVILSGDLLGNDNANLTYTEPTRMDNSRRILDVLNAGTLCIIDGFIFRGGHAEIIDNNEGGSACGIYQLNGRLSLIDCVFEKNVARISPAIRCDLGAALNLTRCIFRDNRANRWGACGMYGTQFNIRDCLFLRNRTADSPNGYQWGGAVEIGGPVNGEPDPTSAGSIINSVFVDNYAAERGGAIYNNGNTDVINCTFFGNSAGIDGQTLHNYSNINFRVSNCIVWGSSGAGSVIGASNYNFSGTYTMVRNSIIQGGHSGTGTVNVLTGDPLFKDPTIPLGADERFGTADDGLRLNSSSPGINTGNNAFVLGVITTDVVGAPRLFATVDLGAYEKGGPTISVNPAPTTIGYAGQSTVFNVIAAGTGTVTYQWRKNGVNILNETSSTLTLFPLTSRSAADYDVVVTDDFDTATSDRAELTVLSPAPDVSISPGDTTVVLGGGLTFVATVNTGIPPYTYQWRKNGATIAKATNPTLVLTIIQRSQEGVYDVVVKNAHGVDVSNPTRLSVPPLVPITTGPQSTTVNPPGTATFTVNVPGATAWQWLKGGKVITGATTNTLMVPNVDASAAGLYSVIVNTPNGKVTTAPAQLRVNDSGLLVYKLVGTGKAYDGISTVNAATSGYLVLDRTGQRGGLILGGKRGNQNIHSVEVHEDLHSQSTGPVPTSQTVVSELVADEFALWLNGADALLTLSKTDKAVGPARMKGYVNSINLGAALRIEAVSLSLTVDALNSAPARLNQETVEQALSRLSQELQAKGSALVE
jgi:hypothetical protein